MIQLPSRLSWSAVSSYAECGERFRLERGYKVPSHTWYSTVGGSAFHEITEDIDRMTVDGLGLDTAAMMAPSFQTVFDKCLERERNWGKSSFEEGKKPDFPREIKPSGKELKTGITEYGGPKKKDYDWWLHFGPIYVQRYLNWRKAMAWEIATLPDGRIGIELEFTVKMGGQPVVGYIDRVFRDPAGGSHIVVDLKSGKRPSGHLQLITYYVGLRETYGLAADWGAFWNPSPPPKPRRKDEEPIETGSPRDWGSASDLIATSDWSLERMHGMYAAMMRGLRQGVFLPQVTSMCSGCTAREWCWAVVGSKRGEIPVVDVVAERGTGEVIFDGSSV